MRKVCVVTVARSDYSILVPVLREIQRRPELQLQLVVAGMHLSPEFGSTVQAIEADGFEIAERVEMTLSTDSPTGVAKSIGLGVIGFADSFTRLQPDLIVLLGDRYEMLAAAVAALPLKLPLAHLHGGEATEALIDEAIRHSITKMSHLHFVSTPAYGRRVIQLGEAPERVVHSGAPGLDNLRALTLLTWDELRERFGITLDGPVLLVTFHPVTLQYEATARHMEELLAALADSGHPIVFTYPNADTHGRVIIDAIDGFVDAHDLAQVVVNLGTVGYYSLLSHAAAMVGNSSSGIIEAASFGLPVVNVGDRQRGRVHGGNVIDATVERGAISAAIRRALEPEFRKFLVGMKNPYGDGRASAAIVDRLVSQELSEAFLLKKFHDLAVGDGEPVTLKEGW